MTAARVLRRVALGLLLLLVFQAAITARLVLEGERALAASDRAFDQGDVRTATLQARAAAIAYVPGAPHVDAAYERLIAIATGAEATGDRELAAAAWRAVRAAGNETRHLWVGRAAEVARANQNLARLEALTTEAPADLGAETAAERLARLEAEASGVLAQEATPRAPWLVVLSVAFALAIGGCLVVATRGVAPDGTLVPAGLRWGVVVFVIGAACWTVAAVAA